MTLEQIDNLQINFIVAGPRTGSTLLATMLNQSNTVLAPSEEPFTFNLFFKYSKIKNWTDKDLKSYCYDFFLFSDGKLYGQFSSYKILLHNLTQFKNDLNFERVIKISYLCFFPYKDKSEVNCIVDKQLKIKDYLSMIARVYKNSKFIFLTRSPLDNVPRVVELRRKKIDVKSTVIKEAIRYKMTYTLLDRELKKLDKSRVYKVKYEDLILNTEHTLKNICSFINIDYKSSMLNYHKTINENINESSQYKKEIKKQHQHFIDIHSGLRVQPDQSKIGLWKREISEEEANQIWTICNKISQLLDYEQPESIKSNVKLPFEYLKFSLRLKMFKILISDVWYNMHYHLRYFIKKVKYGKYVEKYISIVESKMK